TTGHLRAAAPCARGRSGRARSSPPGRLFVTAARQNGADVHTLTDTLVARATAAGCQLSLAEVAQAGEDAGVTAVQAKKIFPTLADAGVTVSVDDSAPPARRRVAAARAATPASK